MRIGRGVLSPTLATLMACCIATLAATKTQPEPTDPLPQQVAGGRATTLPAPDPSCDAEVTHDLAFTPADPDTTPVGWPVYHCLYNSDCQIPCDGYPNFMCKGANPNSTPPKYGVCLCWE